MREEKAISICLRRRGAYRSRSPVNGPLDPSSVLTTCQARGRRESRQDTQQTAFPSWPRDDSHGGRSPRGLISLRPALAPPTRVQHSLSRTATTSFPSTHFSLLQTFKSTGCGILWSPFTVCKFLSRKSFCVAQIHVADYDEHRESDTSPSERRRFGDKETLGPSSCVSTASPERTKERFNSILRLPGARRTEDSCLLSTEVIKCCIVIECLLSVPNPGGGTRGSPQERVPPTHSLRAKSAANAFSFCNTQSDLCCCCPASSSVTHVTGGQEGRGDGADLSERDHHTQRTHIAHSRACSFSSNRSLELIE